MTSLWGFFKRTAGEWGRKARKQEWPGVRMEMKEDLRERVIDAELDLPDHPDQELADDLSERLINGEYWWKSGAEAELIQVVKNLESYGMSREDALSAICSVWFVCSAEHDN